MVKTINRQALLEDLGNGHAPLLLEALPGKYYRQGHLPGARHLPHDKVKERASHIVPDKGQPIVVYCASDTCRNSHIAAEQLAALGYTDIAVYPGGKKDWEEAGLALEK